MQSLLSCPICIKLCYFNMYGLAISLLVIEMFYWSRSVGTLDSFFRLFWPFRPFLFILSLTIAMLIFIFYCLLNWGKIIGRHMAQGPKCKLMESSFYFPVKLEHHVGFIILVGM